MKRNSKKKTPAITLSTNPKDWGIDDNNSFRSIIEKNPPEVSVVFETANGSYVLKEKLRLA